MYSMRSNLVVASLAGVLALGSLGCSASSTVETSTSVTDSEGNTTTTTTSATADENGVSTSTDTTTTDLLDRAAYTNEYFGFAYVLPEGFETTDHDAISDYATIELYAENEDGDSVLLAGVPSVADNEGAEDVESWAAAYKTVLTEAMVDNGEEGIEVDVDTATIGEVLPCACVRSTSELDGEEVYRDYYFIMTDDGDGLRVDLTANDEFVMDELRDGLVGFTVAE